MYAAFYGDHDKIPLDDPSQSPNRKTNLGSALMSTTEELKKLPPTIIFTAGVDPLQGEGEEFGHKLQQAGVPVAIFRCDGQIHDFAMLNPISTSPTAIAAIELAGLKLKQALA
jgi:acetyl esterase